MREEDFTEASPGRLVAAATLDGNYWPAFVPDPLPPEINWNEAVGIAAFARGPGTEPAGWQRSFGFAFAHTC